uniref:Uncharacterized protein n=1 Tax=Nelumbo nucifera TaxID=4432 RepID=A0A822Y867_NELNU|nr:TPA_asm: hypothetical protein HUJ06_029701 [Nelumbo nucifera]
MIFGDMLPLSLYKKENVDDGVKWYSCLHGWHLAKRERGIQHSFGNYFAGIQGKMVCWLAGVRSNVDLVVGGLYSTQESRIQLGKTEDRERFDNFDFKTVARFIVNLVGRLGIGGWPYLRSVEMLANKMEIFQVTVDKDVINFRSMCVIKSPLLLGGSSVPSPPSTLHPPPSTHHFGNE